MNGQPAVCPFRATRQIDVEVLQRDHSLVEPESIRMALLERAKLPGATLGDIRRLSEYQGPLADLQEHVDKIELWEEEEPPGEEDTTMAQDCKLSVYVFKLDRQGAQAEEMEAQEGEGEGGTGITAATHWVLPSEELQGIWESLVYKEGVKKSLLNYVKTTMKVSDHRVDPNLVSWNRIVLLHGPPGTGKTSLCRALAQKLAIRLSHRYRYGQLVEVNSHSLFSKWFSESGKLVQRMFEAIQELVDDPDAFVCVLVDEVESLAAVRKATGSEPSDAIRVVNAMLTQLDKLKCYSNVLLLTTSNITGSIDLAFVDRADLKKYIGLPCQEAAYTMLRGSTDELLVKELLSSASYLLPYRKLQSWLARKEYLSPTKEARSNGAGDEEDRDPTEISKALLEAAAQCEGLSGRAIRKVPFLALVKMEDLRRTFTLPEFLECLLATVREQQEDRKLF